MTEIFTDRTAEFQTDCSQCVFRINNNIGDQVGCQFGFLQHALDKGTNYNFNEDGSYLLTTFCTYCRDEYAALRYGDNPFQGVRNEIKIHYGAIIVDIDQADTVDGVLEQWDKTLKSLLASEILPLKIVFVASTKNMVVHENIMAFLDWKAQNVPSNIPSEIITSYEYNVTPLRLIDAGVTKLNHKQYVMYLVLMAGHTINPDDITKVDILINDEFEQILMVTNEDPMNLHRLLVNKSLHRLVQGSTDGDVRFKIEGLAQLQTLTKTVRTWETL